MSQDEEFERQDPAEARRAAARDRKRRTRMVVDGASLRRMLPTRPGAGTGPGAGPGAGPEPEDPDEGKAAKTP